MQRRLLVTLIVSATVLLAAKKPITLDTLTQRGGRSAEGGGPPVWAPGGKKFAYMKGKSIMLYDVASNNDKELFTLDALETAAAKVPAEERFSWQNRRVRESSFQWAASGNALLLSVGGDLFLWHLDSGKWDQLTNTPVPESDPKLSPDGKMASFRRGYDIYTMDVASRKEARLTHDGSPTLLNGELDWVYPEELDLGTAYWWSPDSKSIAYMQFDTSHEFEYPQVDLKGRRAVLELERYPQAGTPNADVRLGVVSATGGPTKWMDLGETRGHLLARVHWTPDSSKVAVHRLNRVQNELDFLYADPQTGAAKTILHEQDRYWININDDFRFLSNGQFIWPSERSGFMHLYLYSAEGKQLSQITQGNWEVTGVSGLSEAQRKIYYVSSEVSPLERQLYSIGFDGAGKTKLTQESGTHGISMSPACDFYMDTFSSLTSPPRRTLHSSTGQEVAVYREADHKLQDEYQILPTEIVTLKANDGSTLYARMIKPANYQAGKKYPTIVMVYGGPGAQSIRNAWMGADWDQALAQSGFLIWQLDNRGSKGRGHAFESPIYRRFGKTELEDQKTGIEYIVKQGLADPARIGMYGWSYGGYMTLYSLLNAPELFKAGIAGAPVTNWHNYDTIYTERYMGVPSENPEGYTAASAVTYAANLKSKLLIVHNFEDDNVLFQNTLQMSDALEKADKLFSTVIYTGKSHGVAGPARRNLLEITTKFFEENLK